MSFAALRRLASLCVALPALVGLLAPSAHARRQFAQREGVGCLYCHERPGGERNFRGLYYELHDFSFNDFDETFEAQKAGVKPGSQGPEALPTVAVYPQVRVPLALRFTMKDVDGNKVNLGRFQDDVILVVNVASLCGNTPQYASLEKLYQQYQAQGFTILAFPANDFGKQEPGTDVEIKQFCTMKYQVTFPVFSKIVVQGDGQAPLYRFLTNKTTNPRFGGDIEWNFAKFLINRSGEVVARFPAETDPATPSVVSAIEKELAAPRGAK
jgi:glutathione peroxidase